MPKFFVFSDAHSYYKPLKEALDEAGFDANNEEHYLVSCGDVFDRGPDSEELFHFLMGIERKILVRGNHDILIDELCKRSFPYSHDRSNGTVKTIQDIGHMGEGYDFETCCKRTHNKLARYRELLVNYFETKNYIFVHSWIPTRKVEIDNAVIKYIPILKDEYMEDWRNANDVEWEDAMWGNPFNLANEDLNKTGKTIVFGHWHCSTGHSLLSKISKDEYAISEFEDDAIWEPCYFKNTIGIDRCTHYTKKINVLVLEDDFL